MRVLLLIALTEVLSDSQLANTLLWRVQASFTYVSDILEAMAGSRASWDCQLEHSCSMADSAEANFLGGSSEVPEGAL